MNELTEGMPLTPENVMQVGYHGKILESIDGELRVWYQSHTGMFTAAFTNPAVAMSSVYFAVMQDWIGIYAGFGFKETDYA